MSITGTYTWHEHIYNSWQKYSDIALNADNQHNMTTVTSGQSNLT